MTDYLIPIAVGYLLGSLPVGLLAGLAFKHVDIRDFGSGRTGMTNVLRTVGVPAAAVVLVLDMGKGAAPSSRPGSCDTARPEDSRDSRSR